MSSEWIWLLLIAGGIAVFWMNRSEKKARVASANWQVQRVQERVDVARRFYLETLQRELANIIMGEDLEAFEKAFYWMRDWQYEIDKAANDRRSAERNLLLEKFPNLEDFDLVGTKHFIQYNHRPMWGIDELVERYKEISKFLILDVEEISKPRSMFNDKEVEIFRERIQTYKDLRLKAAIDEGMNRFNIWRRDRESQPMFGSDYEDAEYEVFPLTGSANREFTPELEWGIFCKKLNERGLHTYFAYDGGGSHNGYYRTDKTFTEKLVMRT